MDDEEEELALLRKQRKDALGEAGATRGELAKRVHAEHSEALERVGNAEATIALRDAEYDEASQAGVVNDESGARGDWEVGMDADLRAHFPVSFGKQRKKAEDRSRAHEATRRKEHGSTAAPANGASRSPAQDASEPVVGPPRPLVAQTTGEDALAGSGPGGWDAVGPQEVRGQSGHGASGSGRAVGPPRPPERNDRSGAGGETVGPPIQSQDPGEGEQPLVGPPRPPRVDSKERDAMRSQPWEAAVGPPRPPAAGGSRAEAEPVLGPPRPHGGAPPPAGPSVGPTAAPARVLPPVPRFDDAERSSLPRGGTGVGGGGGSEAGAGGGSEAGAGGGQRARRALPASNEVVLQGHSKLVSAVDVDRAGARVVTGGMDYQISLYDFNAMKADCRPFRQLTPHDGHPLVAVSFSPTGDAFLAVTGEPRAKVYSRDGHERGEFKRGDMYLRDLKNTKGHVSGCTHGQWHPIDKTVAATASTDGTVRLWDCKEVTQKMVIKPSTGGAGRVPATACCFSPDGSLIAAALANGMLQLWSAAGDFGRSAALAVVPVPRPQQALFGKQDWKYATTAKQTLRGAHAAGSDIADVKVLSDNRTVLSRGGDDTVKLWDLRRFRDPVHVWDAPLSHTHTRLCVSPQEDLVLTGISTADGRSGALVAYRLSDGYECVQQLGMPAAVTAVRWHPILNQILVATGDRSAGAVHVLYSPDASVKGALMCVGKRQRPKDPFDFQPPLLIHTPGALPMFRDDNWRKRKHVPDHGAQQRAKIPDPGPTIAGSGGGGKIGASNSTLLTQYLLEKGGMKKLEEQMDPREAFLRHKDADEELGRWTAAYAKTQPTKQFAEQDEEEEGSSGGGSHAGPNAGR